MKKNLEQIAAAREKSAAAESAASADGKPEQPEEVQGLSLTREQEMTLEKLHRAFIDNGVNLDPQSQERLRAINKELAVLEQRFGNNVLSATNAFRLVLTDTSETAGLPASVLSAAASEASREGITPREAARMKGIPAELLLFPDENHWVLQPQNGILWQRTFFNWLDRWLKK